MGRHRDIDHVLRWRRHVGNGEMQVIHAGGQRSRHLRIPVREGDHGPDSGLFEECADIPVRHAATRESAIENPAEVGH